MFFNFPLVTSLITLIFAQVIKLPINYIINKEYTPRIILSTGGMPSSHSAFVTALLISIGLQEGVYGPEFAIAFVLAGVVIHDAMGIRREAGKHATVLNKMGEDIQYLINSVSDTADNKPYNQKFKELLGHEPSEAISGIIIGIIIALICYWVR